MIRPAVAVSGMLAGLALCMPAPGRAQGREVAPTASDSVMARMRSTTQSAVQAAGDSAADVQNADTGADAAALADTSQRVTGTILRFGWPQRRVQATVFLESGSSRGPRGEVVRTAQMRWFGIESVGTLHFRSDHLVSATFAAKDVPPHARSYAEDELRRAGYRRECERIDATSRDCTWLGRTRVHVVIKDAQLEGSVERVVRPPPAPPAAAALVPDTLIMGRPGLAQRYPLPEMLDPPRVALPEAAREAGIQGNVWVLAAVDTGGAVTSVALIKGIALLDSVALDAARQVRFKPYTLDGVPQRLNVEFPVRFIVGN